MNENGDQLLPRTFTTTFLYAVWGLRVLFLVLMLAILCLYSFFLIPIILSRPHVKPSAIIGITAALLLLVWITYWVIHRLIHQRWILRLSDHIEMRRSFTRKWDVIPANAFKGFSRGTYYTRLWSFELLILYMQDGRHLELPQFLYRNFAAIPRALETAGIAYLGKEQVKWRWSLKRWFTFD